MHPLQLISDSLLWAGKNLAFNLNAIPDDKLRWCPAPGAKSALEIAEHLIDALNKFDALVGGTPQREKSTLSTREQVQNALEAASARYAQTLLALSEADLSGEMEVHVGTLPKIRAVTIPLLDALHHHGQIAYIQTLLGDTTTHYFHGNG